ncbi:MAG: hypothetical protein GYA57_06160 [Myxococcales bacterium]|nr:hypothetical protein [Myxococcales bacterium]
MRDVRAAVAVVERGACRAGEQEPLEVALRRPWMANSPRLRAWNSASSSAAQGRRPRMRLRLWVVGRQTCRSRAPRDVEVSVAASASR